MRTRRLDRVLAEAVRSAFRLLWRARLHLARPSILPAHTLAQLGALYRTLAPVCALGRPPPFRTRAQTVVRSRCLTFPAILTRRVREALIVCVGGWRADSSVFFSLVSLFHCSMRPFSRGQSVAMHATRLRCESPRITSPSSHSAVARTLSRCRSWTLFQLPLTSLIRVLPVGAELRPRRARHQCIVASRTRRRPGNTVSFCLRAMLCLSSLVILPSKSASGNCQHTHLYLAHPGR